jgi:hypothetical protein
MDANAILFAIALGVLLAGVPSFGFWLQRLPGYSWTKNQRSLFASWTRPRILRRKTISCWRSTAFSAPSRIFDLNGEAKIARTKRSCPIIPPA